MDNAKHIKQHPRYRLSTWDYASPASYFVTFCTRRRGEILGILQASDADLFSNAHILLSEKGKAVDRAARRSIQRYPAFDIRMYTIMPDHVHAVIDKVDDFDDKTTLGMFVSCWKREATRQIGGLEGDAAFWQRNYYDHVIRNEEDLNRIMEYIANNPHVLSLKGLFI